MKEIKIMMKALKNADKEDKQAMMLTVGVFALTYCGIWLAAILQGNV